MDCLCPFFNGTSFLYLQTINISRSLPSRKSKQFSAIQAEEKPECGQAVKQNWRLLDPLSFGKNNQWYRVFFEWQSRMKKKVPNISHRIQVENSGKWKNSECKHFLKFKIVKKNSWPSFWANCAGAFFHVFVGSLGCSDPLWLLIGEKFLWTKFCSDPKKTSPVQNHNETHGILETLVRETPMMTSAGRHLHWQCSKTSTRSIHLSINRSFCCRNHYELSTIIIFHYYQ